MPRVLTEPATCEASGIPFASGEGVLKVEYFQRPSAQSLDDCRFNYRPDLGDFLVPSAMRGGGKVCPIELTHARRNYILEPTSATLILECIEKVFEDNLDNLE